LKNLSSKVNILVVMSKFVENFGYQIKKIAIF